MLWRLAWLGVLIALESASVARADDWLAVLPECADERAASGAGAELLYPRVGLPAVVAAGDLLVARVRLPLPLTPPPGIQQARALEGFAAELRARTPSLDGTLETPHAYPLAVLGVRPEGASSLRYRVRLALPAWAAPGSYDLLLRAAGVALRVDQSVAVLGPGATARLSPLPAVGPPALPAGMRLPVDVWIASEPPLAGALGALGAPVLTRAGLVAALRVGGRGLWVHGECASGSPAFRHEVDAVLVVERRMRTADPLAAPAAPAVPGGGARPQPAVAWTRTRAGARSQLRASTEHAVELAFGLQAGPHRLHASAGELELHPATELPTGKEPAALVARLRLAGPGTAVLTLAPAAQPRPEAVLQLRPQPVQSGQPFSVRAQVTRPSGRHPPRVAYRFDWKSTAFGREPVQHRIGPLGRSELRALVLFEDGTALATGATVQVVSASAVGCHVAGVRAQPAPQAAWLLWPLLGLLKRRARGGAGNRLGRRWRWPRRPPTPRELAPVALEYLVKHAAQARLCLAELGLGLVLGLALGCLGAGCAHKPIPNTRVEDTTENREVIDFVEKYRKAVEARDSPMLLKLTSRDYFDDMGTPQGDDDVDYETLQVGLGRIQKELLDARYQISYRGVTYAPNQRVLVDLLYTGWFKVETPDGPQWRRKLEPHRIVLAREEGNYRIISGM